MKASSLLLLVSMLSAGPYAYANDISSTTGLVAMCSSDGADYGYCLGFVSGSAAVMEQIGRGGSGDFRVSMGMCVSAPYPSAQAEVQAFVTWAKKHPEAADYPNAVGVILALADRWPCAGQG